MKFQSNKENTNGEECETMTKVFCKSQFGCDFRRFAIVLNDPDKPISLAKFIELVENVHKLTDEQKAATTICYVSKDGTTLPFSNDDCLEAAFLSARSSTLKILVRHKGECLEDQFGYGISAENVTKRRKNTTISAPQDFRRVSSILDADTLPWELRRVQLCKSYSNKPLGFFIRDGSSVRITQWGLVPAPGIFISRLLPNGLAASTNLIGINDEIIQVNGIDISGKSLDQATDIMTANAANLILTTRPYRPTPYHPMQVMAPPPYATLPRAHLNPPGYSNQSPMMHSYHQPSYYGNAGLYEDFYDESRLPVSRGSNRSQFSRDSTHRISNEMSKMSIGSQSPNPYTTPYGIPLGSPVLQQGPPRRRPMSMHAIPPPHHLYPISNYNYGY